MRRRTGDGLPPSDRARTLYAACRDRRERGRRACSSCPIRDICEAQRWNEPPASTTYIVEVGSGCRDLSELMADMRMWLDHRHIEARQFDEFHRGPAVALVVGFRAAGDAAAFAEAFRGSLRSAVAAPHSS